MKVGLLHFLVGQEAMMLVFSIIKLVITVIGGLLQNITLRLHGIVI